ncbi:MULTISPECIES: hypothetical protein [unclassified Mesorhizobium]|uniref:hypothetical protein n=1 Tax=unclassified Mesorhizobium TaxID=325217 RepID=UPI0011293DE7|nr:MULTISPECIES: hypothetical protein [unclassified Mesorhizobium]TPJ31088.1 hypothetical protein FJ418_22000 [Mesorhizobium sp. B2-8-3]UCI28010.1 hypothetical protein FJ430_10575 [Mesorhizobium sp. B2-8-5]
MPDTTFKEKSHRRRSLREDPIRRGEIAQKIASAINATVSNEIISGMHEPVITTSIRNKLEEMSQRGDLNIQGYSLAVYGCEAVAMGKSSQEITTGIDLYFGVEISDDDYVSKGLLIQAKKANQLRGEKLITQCAKMTRLNPEAYVWIYEPEGVRILSASSILGRRETSVAKLKREDMVDHIDAILECSKGSPFLALPTGPNKRAALSEMMNQLHAKAALELVISRS